MKYTFITLLALSSTALAAYEPETVGINLDNPEVVTEVNYTYAYTASINKNNGGGFITSHTYNTGDAFSTSKHVNDYLNNSYIEFSATLTAADVTCSNTKHEYGCDVFQATFEYVLEEGSIAKRVFGFNVSEDKWKMNVFDLVYPPTGDPEVINPVYTVTGNSYTADTSNAKYRFTSSSNGITFTRDGETLIESAVAVPNPYKKVVDLTPDGCNIPGYEDVFIKTYEYDFEALTATLGKTTSDYEGGDPQWDSFELENHAGYLMWRPIDGEITDGSLPAMAAYLMTYEAPPMVPEPTTATLSLLALAGLAARRRRK